MVPAGEIQEPGPPGRSDVPEERERVSCVAVMGPTATGKTRLAVELARRFDGEIISVDSRQVYRGLDIGSGKDLAEYTRGGKPVKYHLIDVVDVREEYDLYRYLQDAYRAVEMIARAGHLPIFAGGTALYLNALLDNYRLEGRKADPPLRHSLKKKTTEELLSTLKNRAPDLYRKVRKDDRGRVLRAVEIARTRDSASGISSPGFVLDALLIAPYYHRSVVHQRIENRLDQRLEQGLIEEVEMLHERQEVCWERLESFGLEYRYVTRFLREELRWEEMRDCLLAKIRRFARSQDIWARKMERAGKDIYWLPKGDVDQAKDLVKKFLNHEELPPPEIRLKKIFYGPRSNPSGQNIHDS